MQYNYSHDNQGLGYLLAQFPGAPAMHDLTVRCNISENDAHSYLKEPSNSGHRGLTRHCEGRYLQQYRLP